MGAQGIGDSGFFVRKPEAVQNGLRNLPSLSSRDSQVSAHRSLAPEVFHSKNSPPCDKQPLLKISVVEYSTYEPAITRGVSTHPRGAPPFSRTLREGGDFDFHCPGKTP